MSIVGSTTNLMSSPPNGDRGSPNQSVSQPTTRPGNQAAQQLSLWWIAVPLLILVLLIMVLLIMVFSPDPNVSAGHDSPAIGKAAPRLDLVQLTDEPVLDRLDVIPEGKVTLLHFWGTWCGPCKIEYPHLSTLANRLEPSPKFCFVPVSCEHGQGETFDGLWQKTHQYFASEKIDSIAFADPRGITRRSAAERLERRSMFYPTSILVGADGNIVGVWEGYTPESVDQMESVINRLLSGSAAEI